VPRRRRRAPTVPRSACRTGDAASRTSVRQPATGVDDAPNPAQDRPREGRGLLDVGVDAWILLSHGISPACRDGRGGVERELEQRRPEIGAKYAIRGAVVDRPRAAIGDHSQNPAGSVRKCTLALARPPSAETTNPLTTYNSIVSRHSTFAGTHSAISQPRRGRRAAGAKTQEADHEKPLGRGRGRRSRRPSIHIGG